VTIPAIKAAGVTSNAGFHALVFAGVTKMVATSTSPPSLTTPPLLAISFTSTTLPRTVQASHEGRCSIMMDRPEVIVRSRVVTGAATRTGMGGFGEKGCGEEQRSEIWYVEILFAVSPLAAILFKTKELVSRAPTTKGRTNGPISTSDKKMHSLLSNQSADGGIAHHRVVDSERGELHTRESRSLLVGSRLRIVGVG
jgi:hypothetical protein